MVCCAMSACTADGATGVLPNNTVTDGDVTVTAADPDTATVDTTITVRITGTGFTDGSTATWTVDSLPSQEIRTVSTTYLSPTQIDAVIVISEDAQLRAYNIRIRTKKGKQGIGVERFRVVAKPVPLPEPGIESEAMDVNDAGVIVGNVTDAAGVHWAIRWAPSDSGWRYDLLGRGSATVVSSNNTILWNNWDAQTPGVHRFMIRLPSGADVDFGDAWIIDISSNGTLIGSVRDKTDTLRAVVWRRRTPTSWGEPEDLPVPPGYSATYFNAINGTGDIVGSISRQGVDAGVVWRFRDGAWQMPTLLDGDLRGGAYAITDAGALAGWIWPCVSSPNCYSYPAFWPSLGATRRILPTLYNTQGFVHGMNETNHVVGSALVHYDDGSGPLAALVRHAVVWFPGGGLPEDLGAIQTSQWGEARAINNQGLIVGSIRGFDQRNHAIYWRLP